MHLRWVGWEGGAASEWETGLDGERRELGLEMRGRVRIEVAGGG